MSLANIKKTQLNRNRFKISPSSILTKSIGRQYSQKSVLPTTFKQRFEQQINEINLLRVSVKPVKSKITFNYLLTNYSINREKVVSDNKNFDSGLATENLKNEHLRRLLQEMNSELDEQMEKKGSIHKKETMPILSIDKRLDILKKEDENNHQILVMLQRDMNTLINKKTQLNSYDHLRQIEDNIELIKHKILDVKKDIDMRRKDTGRQGKNIIEIEQDYNFPQNKVNTNNLEFEIKEMQHKNDYLENQINFNDESLQKLQKNDNDVLSKKITDKTNQGNLINALSQNVEVKKRHQLIQAKITHLERNREILNQSMTVNDKLLKQEIDKKIQYINLIDEQINGYQMEILKLKQNLDKICYLAINQGFQVKSITKISESNNQQSKTVITEVDDLQKKYPKMRNQINSVNDESFKSEQKEQRLETRYKQLDLLEGDQEQNKLQTQQIIKEKSIHQNKEIISSQQKVEIFNSKESEKTQINQNVNSNNEHQIEENHGQSTFVKDQNEQDQDLDEDISDKLSTQENKIKYAEPMSQETKSFEQTPQKNQLQLQMNQDNKNELYDTAFESIKIEETILKRKITKEQDSQFEQDNIMMAKKAENNHINSEQNQQSNEHLSTDSKIPKPIMDEENYNEKDYNSESVNVEPLDLKISQSKGIQLDHDTPIIQENDNQDYNKDYKQGITKQNHEQILQYETELQNQPTKNQENHNQNIIQQNIEAKFKKQPSQFVEPIKQVSQSKFQEDQESHKSSTLKFNDDFSSIPQQLMKSNHQKSYDSNDDELQQVENSHALQQIDYQKFESEVKQQEKSPENLNKVKKHQDKQVVEYGQQDSVEILDMSLENQSQSQKKQHKQFEKDGSNQKVKTSNQQINQLDNQTLQRGESSNLNQQQSDLSYENIEQQHSPPQNKQEISNLIVNSENQKVSAQDQQVTINKNQLQTPSTEQNEFVDLKSTEKKESPEETETYGSFMKNRRDQIKPQQNTQDNPIIQQSKIKTNEQAKTGQMDSKEKQQLLNHDNKFDELDSFEDLESNYPIRNDDHTKINKKTAQKDINNKDEQQHGELNKKLAETETKKNENKGSFEDEDFDAFDELI